MYEGPGTILGGLPVICVAEAGKDPDTLNGPGEYWEEVLSIHWQKHDGSKGKEIPQHIRDRAEAYDYGFCDLLEQVSSHIMHERWLQEQAASVGTHPEGQDGKAGLVRSMGDAVGAAETPNPSPITPNGA